MSLPLSFKAIQTVAQWQNYGSGSRPTMNALAKLLPDFASVPVYSGPAYRLVGLSKADLRKLVKEGSLPCRLLEGWTKSQAICHRYLQDSYGALLKPDTALVVIFGIQVKKAALDLEALWKMKEWKDAVEAFEDAGKFFDEGLDFRGSQKEVIVSQPAVRLKDVVEVIAKGGSTVKGAKCLPFLQKYVQEKASLIRVVSRLQETSAPEDPYGSQWPNSGYLMTLRQTAKLVRKVLKIKPGRSFGTCDLVSVGVWDQLGRPKNLIPTSVLMPDGDEHVILKSAEGWVFDPTSDQYDLPDVTSAWNVRTRYRSPKRLTQKDLDAVRKTEVLAQPSVYTRTYVDRVRRILDVGHKQVTRDEVEKVLHSLNVPANIADDVLAEILAR